MLFTPKILTVENSSLNHKITVGIKGWEVVFTS